MDERLARLTRLFYTLQRCAERINTSNLEVEEDAYRFAVTRIGQILMEVGGEKYVAERSITQHWINRGEQNVDELLQSLQRRGRHTITAADVARLIESAPGPDDPTPFLMRR